MNDTPVPFERVEEQIRLLGLSSVGNASIREIKKLVDNVEADTGIKYIRMEMGIPGLPPAQIGVNAEIEALKGGIAAIYPNISGITPLKNEISRFLELFMGVEVSPEACIPTVGSMQGSFAAFTTVTRMYPEKNRILFIDPGFPVHKQQCMVQGIPFDSFDVYDYRGDKLREKLEEKLSNGKIAALLYSNPNNPSWICFTEKELRTIGELSQKYNVICLEDLAYFGMDFRKDFSKPGIPPYQPTVANYTENYILFISSSKAFSYAGQRIGMMAISNKLFNSKAEGLKRFYNSDNFGHSMVYGTIYALSSGTSHSAQYALHAMLKAANDGTFNFIEPNKEYARKAKVIKEMFLKNGFRLVYDKDEDQPLADGFFFTVSYPGFTGSQLVEKLVYYGISAISLSTTGSERTEGIRVCVSLVYPVQFMALEYRLRKFHEHHR